MNFQLRDNTFTLGNFGIEIEFFNADRNTLIRELQSRGISVRAEGYNHTTRSHWKIVGDASVRGQNGAELVSPILNGEDGIEQVRKVSEALVAARAKVNRSTGLHVHHEARDFNNRNDLKRVARFYARCEKHVDAFMAPSRRLNNAYYCQSVIGREDHITVSASSRRYFKVNFQSYYRQRTIEFRHHGGTVEFDKISNWILFTALIVNRAKERVGTSRPFNKLYDVVFHIGCSGQNLDPRLKEMVKFLKARTKHFASN